MRRRFTANRSYGDLISIGYRRIIGLSTGNLRLLPDFILIGAQRAGTTSLFNYLSQHPQVQPSVPKEVHYFSNFYHKGISWYRSHFPLARDKQNFSGSKKAMFITGEATPYYLSHPRAPQRAYQTVPNAQIVIILRNPIDRAYSHYHHEVRMGFEDLPFEKAIDKEGERLDHELENLIRDGNFRSFNYQHFSYLSRGHYLDQIVSWKKHFPSEQMLILNSEAFFEMPDKILQKLTDFLELPNLKLVSGKKYNATPYPEMQAATRERLSDYFKPHNQRLTESLGVDYGWGG